MVRSVSGVKSGNLNQFILSNGKKAKNTTNSIKSIDLPAKIAFGVGIAGTGMAIKEPTIKDFLRMTCSDFSCSGYDEIEACGSIFRDPYP